jgi:hypothetical protein
MSALRDPEQKEESGSVESKKDSPTQYPRKQQGMESWDCTILCPP